MSEFSVNESLKTCSNASESSLKPIILIKEHTKAPIGPKFRSQREALTAKKALELLIGDTLKETICRYCLYSSQDLSELDQILQIGGCGALYKVTIRDIIASFHPFKVANDPNLPNKICQKCVNKAIRSYLFAQQCERSERALRNCFDDLHEKFDKLDPIEKAKKRGRHKKNPNYNVLYAEHRLVIDYAEPLRNMINVGTESLTNKALMSELECKKCWQVLPNVESLVNHEKIHPNTMWYNCRTCGRSFSKRYQINKHLRSHLKSKSLVLPEPVKNFQCKLCVFASEDCHTHLQHVEKHKFQTILQHLVEGNMDKLCSMCLDKNKEMVDLDKMICLHGGYPELTGDKSVYTILGTSVHEMNILRNYTGTKICVTCLDHAITSYVFIHRIHNLRSKLNVCLSNMIDKLSKIEPDNNKMFIEIAQDSIMPKVETYDQNLLLHEDEIDENKLKVHVLEDEFRTHSDSDQSENENERTSKHVDDEFFVMKNKSRIITYEKKTPKKLETKLVNGYNNGKSKMNVCSEFLTFKKKRIKKSIVKYTCPLCNRHFVSEYFLKKHLFIHVNKQVQCKTCYKHFNTKFHLAEHFKITHIMNQTGFSCDCCKRVFTTQEKNKLHQNCHSSKVCELCSKTFASQKHYDSHLQRHGLKMKLNKKSETCSFCEKDCASQNDLSVHVNKVHLQIKPYGCDMCDRKFYTDSDLRHHKRHHSLFSKEKCDLCSKTLKSRRQLVVHIRKHIGVKPFKCFLCFQDFYSELETKKHMTKWHGGSYACKLCKKVFLNKYGLKDHVNSTHSVF